MQKPDDIPEDVWADATSVYEAIRALTYGGTMPMADVKQVIARAILAERERPRAPRADANWGKPVEPEPIWPHWYDQLIDEPD